RHLPRHHHNLPFVSPFSPPSPLLAPSHTLPLIPHLSPHKPVPPLAVLLTAGCGADLLINIALTILGYLPGHIHAFYILYIFYRRREAARGLGGLDGENGGGEDAPGIYSERVQSGGARDGGGRGGYGAIGGSA
ncbi:MAG: hypothetical protein Q9169_008681, partial [Polycauliona sp. 2 TL-2023]